MNEPGECPSYPDLEIRRLEAKNGRIADYFTVTGRHTAENSDCFYLNRELGLIPGQKAAIVQLVADGVTSGGLVGIDFERELMTGQFIAQKIIELLPVNFDRIDQNTSWNDRFFSALEKTSIDIQSEFLEEFGDAFRRIPERSELLGVSTVTGLIETEDSFVIFSVGDSQTVFLPSDPDQKIEYTRRINVSHSSIGVRLFKDHLNCGVADFTSPIFDFKIIPKKNVPKGSRALSFSDGIFPGKPFSDFLNEFRRTGSDQLLTDLYYRAEKIDETYREKNPDYDEDDKTAVITDLK